MGVILGLLVVSGRPVANIRNLNPWMCAFGIS